MWNPEPRVAEEKGRGWSGEGRLVWVGGSRRGSKWRKMLDHDCNKKERGPERRRRRAIRPATVIRFHLNLWTLNDFPWVETACQRCVCVSVCVRVQEKDKESVSTLTSAVQTPHFTASAPLSIAPCSLYAPSLFFYFASTRPPPRCVARTAIYSSRATIKTLIFLCLPEALLLAFCQLACFDLSDWFLDSQAVIQSACNCLAFLSVRTDRNMLKLDSSLAC